MLRLQVLIALMLGLGLPAAFAGSSARADDTSTAALVVEPLGYAVYPIPTRAAELSYYLAPGNAVGLSYAQGTQEQLLTTYKAQLTLVRYHLLFGASWRFNAGLGSRRIDYFRTRTADGITYDASVHVQSLVAEVSAGNQLDFGRLVIGCDWIGIVAPLAKLSAKEDFPATLSDDDKASYRADAAKFHAQPTLQFMRLFAGVVF